MGLHVNDPISLFVSEEQPQWKQAHLLFLSKQGDVSTPSSVPVFCSAGRAPPVPSAEDPSGCHVSPRRGLMSSLPTQFKMSPHRERKTLGQSVSS